jgi:hypothetical protein
MRAVNLVPSDLRKGATAVGRSGGAVYILLGTLAGLVVLGALYALAIYQVSDRNAQLAKANQDAASAQARAQQLAPYTQFADLRNMREQEISNLAGSRFDWPTQMRNVASALPADVNLHSFDATMGASSGAGGGSAAPAAAAPTGAAGSSGAGQPNVHLTGCATSHTEVGDVVNRLRGIPGVTGVSFTSSQKAQTSSSQASSSSSNNACPNITDASFDVTVNFVGAGSTGKGSGVPSSPGTGSTVPVSAPGPSASSTSTGAHP